MIKRLLATTALALIMAGPAYADGATKASETRAGESASATMQTEQRGEFQASNLIGMRVYSSQEEFDETATVQPNAHEEWEDIGEVNDIILNSDGTVEAVIVGVGGVLGIGEKDVELSMQDITVVPQEGDSDDFYLVVKADLQELESMPAYSGSGEDATGERQASESEAADGLTDDERQAEAPAAPGDDEQQAATPPPPPEPPAGEQEMAQGEQPQEAVPPSEAERAPEEGVTEAERQPMDQAEGEIDQQPTDQAEGEADEPSMDTAEREGPREALPRPNMTREGFAEAPPEELTADKLEGASVYDANEENIGDINRLVLTEDGQIETVVLDIGGFLGFGQHQIGVSMEEIQVLRDEGGEFRVYVDATKEQLESQPEYQEGDSQQ